MWAGTRAEGRPSSPPSPAACFLNPRLRTEGRSGARSGGEGGAAPTAGGARGLPGRGRAGVAGGEGV